MQHKEINNKINRMITARKYIKLSENIFNHIL